MDGSLLKVFFMFYLFPLTGQAMMSSATNDCPSKVQARVARSLERAPSLLTPVTFKVEQVLEGEEDEELNENQEKTFYLAGSTSKSFAEDEEYILSYRGKYLCSSESL